MLIWITIVKILSKHAKILSGQIYNDIGIDIIMLNYMGLYYEYHLNDYKNAEK